MITYEKKTCPTYFLTTLGADATLALGEIADDSIELAWQYIFFEKNTSLFHSYSFVHDYLRKNKYI